MLSSWPDISYPFKHTSWLEYFDWKAYFYDILSFKQVFRSCRFNDIDHDAFLYLKLLHIPAYKYSFLIPFVVHKFVWESALLVRWIDIVWIDWEFSYLEIFVMCSIHQCLTLFRVLIKFSLVRVALTLNINQILVVLFILGREMIKME